MSLYSTQAQLSGGLLDEAVQVRHLNRNVFISASLERHRPRAVAWKVMDTLLNQTSKQKYPLAWPTAFSWTKKLHKILNTIEYTPKVRLFAESGRAE